MSTEHVALLLGAFWVSGFLMGFFVGLRTGRWTLSPAPSKDTHDEVEGAG